MQKILVFAACLSACLVPTGCNVHTQKSLVQSASQTIQSALPGDMGSILNPLIADSTDVYIDDMMAQAEADEQLSLQLFSEGVWSTGEDGRTYQWSYPRTGSNGSITLMDSTSKEGRRCRPFRQDFDLLERRIRSSETVCLDPETGNWVVQPRPRSASSGQANAMAAFALLLMMGAIGGGGGGGSDDPSQNCEDRVCNYDHKGRRRCRIVRLHC